MPKGGKKIEEKRIRYKESEEVIGEAEYREGSNGKEGVNSGGVKTNKRRKLDNNSSEEQEGSTLEWKKERLKTSKKGNERPEG